MRGCSIRPFWCPLHGPHLTTLVAFCYPTNPSFILGSYTTQLNTKLMYTNQSLDIITSHFVCRITSNRPCLPNCQIPRSIRIFFTGLRRRKMGPSHHSPLGKMILTSTCPGWAIPLNLKLFPVQFPGVKIAPDAFASDYTPSS